MTVITGSVAAKGDRYRREMMILSVFALMSSDDPPEDREREGREFHLMNYQSDPRAHSSSGRISRVHPNYTALYP